VIELTGQPSSEGLVIGKAFILVKHFFKIPRYRINVADIENEEKKFFNALKNTKEYFLSIKKTIKQSIPTEQLYIFDVYLMFLEDKKFISEVIKFIEKRLMNAEFAVLLVISKIIKSFRNIEDEYFKERSYDFEHIGTKLINEMIGNHVEKVLDNISENEIVISYDISPTDATLLINKKVKGFITERGSKTSHTSILARSFGIPAVVGVQDICEKVDNGDTIILDGFLGKVIIRPDRHTLKVYKEKERRYFNYIKELDKLKNVTVTTLDGYAINLYSNIEISEEIKLSNEYHANGVGLYRTEFMYLAKGDISEEEQYNILKDAILLNHNKPIIIRTFDLGGEKLSNLLPHDKEENPALGLRAIRYSLKYEDFFKKQLRAILRAAVFGNVSVMLPMISGIEEIRLAKGIINKVKKELTEEQIEFKNNVPIGVMVELPSLALISNIAAKEVDFFSVGSNDLIQYTLGIDRGNANVSYLYRPTHLAILLLLENILKAANKNKIEVTVCGEIAGEPKYIAELLGLGYRNFSMSPAYLLRAKMIIKRLSVNDCKKLIRKLKKNKMARESEEHLSKFIEKYASDVYFR
jgi:phosphotransferase system enzyme I (PtsI)